MAKFTQNVRLTRWIDPLYRKRRNRASTAAFRLDRGPPRETFLSVNSLEIERIKDITEYYRDTLQKDGNEVAVCIHKVAEYNSTGRFTGLPISYNRSSLLWEYPSSNVLKPAYRHRPVPKKRGRKSSSSHSGVEFIEALDDIAERKFARRMALRRKFHLY